MPAPDFGADQHAPAAPAAPSNAPDFGERPPPDDGSGWMGSIGAGLKGAAKEAVGVTGLAPEWAKSNDPGHSTAEWVGRQAADFSPSVAVDIAAPEIGFLPTAYRGAKLANAGLNAAWKGAFGGATTKPGDPSEGAKTGAETSVPVELARAGWQMLPRSTRRAIVYGGPMTLASVVTLAHELGLHKDAPYIPPWLVHHIISPLAALAATAGKAPATSGAASSKVEQFLEK